VTDKAVEFCKYLLAKANVATVASGYKMRYKHNGKIVMTHNTLHSRFCLTLPVDKQHEFCPTHNEHLHPVPNKFGELGYTLAYYQHVPKTTMLALIDCAYDFTARPKEKIIAKKSSSHKRAQSSNLYYKALTKDGAVYYEQDASAIARTIIVNNSGIAARSENGKKLNTKTASAIPQELFESLWQRTW
jgi:hypothetical protein